MASTTISLPPSPVFTWETYELWVAKMKGYFIAYSLWEIVNDGAQPPPLPNDPTVAQSRNHNEEVAKEGKPLILTHFAVNDDILTRLMDCEKAKKLGTD